MKKHLIQFAVVGASLLALNAQQLLDGVAAIVGDKPILYSEVDQVAQLFAMQARIPSYADPQVYQELRQRSLEELINQQVLLEYARQETIEVEDRNVDMQLDQSLESITQQYGSLEEAAKIFGVDRRKIRSYYEDQIRNNMLIEQVKYELFNDIKVSRREVEEFFVTWQDSFPDKNPQVDFSILSLQVKAGAAQKAILRQRLDSLKQAISDGSTTFADAAREFSQDPGSAVNGGNLGFVGRGVFVKPFEEAAFSMEVGELSDIVESGFGLHLLRLEDKRPNQVNVSHILLIPTRGESDIVDATQRADSIRNALLDGSLTFAEAIDNFVEDEFIRSNKGRMGLTDISLLPVELHEILMNIPLDQYSMPFSTGDQVHLILVHERKPGGKVNLDDHWSEIENMALEFKKRDRYDSWIEDQRQRMYILVNF